MTLVSRPLEALFGGVSQQPATLRLDSQCEALVNGYATVVDGLRKRPPARYVARVTTSSLAESAFIHTINRDTSERYIVVITDGNLQVFDQDGAEQTVNFPEGQAYLTSADPKESFAVVSIADYSFIVNRGITVATKAAPSSQPNSYENWYLPNTWFRDGTANPENYFNPTQGGFQGTVQLFEDLPSATDASPPSEGDVYRVAGYDRDSFGTFYVIRRGGVWEETHAPVGGSITLDELTMPHALVREADGTFTFTQFGWKARQFGDDDSNPPPSFVGRAIKDVMYYKNRLGFIADENVVFSGAGDFGNFWRNTVTDLLDSDRVDVAVSSTKVSVLEYAVPFNNNLMLFADQTQFALNVDELLTPSTVSVDTVTDYEMSTRVRPVAIGNDVYFVTESGEFSRIREYFVEDNKNQTDASDITAHVPRYLPQQISQLAGNSNEDILFAISDATGHRNRVYVYKFFWNADGKVQSAWKYWEFDPNDRVISIADLENQLFLLIERADGVYLEAIDVQSGAVAPNLSFDILLDRRTELTGGYNGVSDTTLFPLPYPVPAGTARDNFQLVRGAGYTGEVGSLIDPTGYVWVNDTTVSVPGDEAGTVIAGVAYDFRFEFSEQFMKSGDRTITTGRLMLRTFTIYYTDTAFFSTEVAPYGNDPLVEEIIPSQLSAFSGKTLGSESLRIGEPAFHTGSYSFQIHGDSTTAVVALRNASHLQCRIQSAEWEALYHNRARAL